MIKNLIFLGAPGVGKGTLAKEVAKSKGLVHISTGDIFRKEIAAESELGLKVKAILAAGEYVSDDITNAIVKKTLESSEVKAKGFILDGYPRTINQAEFLKSINVHLDGAVLLKAADSVVQSRLESRAKIENRQDDTPEVIAKRIEVYNEKTAPLINWYKNEDQLIEIDAEGSIQDNYDNLIKGVF